MDTTIFVNLNAIPLHQDVEQSHGICQSALEIEPDTMHHLLKMADQRQHRQNRFHNHARVPFATTAEAQIVRLPILFGKTRIGKDSHIGNVAVDKVLKSGTIMYIGGVHSPIYNQAQVIQEETQLATDNPTIIRQPFASNLCFCAPFPTWVNQFDPIRIANPMREWSARKLSVHRL